MAHITPSVEYAIHSLPWLVVDQDKPLSSRNIADLRKISPSFLDIVDAIEGEKLLLNCQEVRERCAVYAGGATAGRCAIHAVMLLAKKAMRQTLAAQTLGSVAAVVGRKAPSEFIADVQDWIGQRVECRTARVGRRGRDHRPRHRGP